MNAAALEEIGLMVKDIYRVPYYFRVPIVFPSLSVVYPATGFHERLMETGAPVDVYERFTKWERENESYRKGLHGYFAHGNGGVPIGIIDLDALRSGEIKIKPDELTRVKNYVNRLRLISGIKVHNFKNEKRTE